MNDAGSWYYAQSKHTSRNPVIVPSVYSRSARRMSSVAGAKLRTAAGDTAICRGEAWCSGAVWGTTRIAQSGRVWTLMTGGTRRALQER